MKKLKLHPSCARCSYHKRSCLGRALEEVIAPGALECASTGEDVTEAVRIAAEAIVERRGSDTAKAS